MLLLCLSPLFILVPLLLWVRVPSQRLYRPRCKRLGHQQFGIVSIHPTVRRVSVLVGLVAVGELDFDGRAVEPHVFGTAIFLPVLIERPFRRQLS